MKHSDVSDLREFVARRSKGALDECEKDALVPVVNWLNRKEFVGIVVGNGTMHEKTYASWWGYEYVQDWSLADRFIEALRDAMNDPTLFEHFEKLATCDRFRKRSRAE